MARTHRSSTKHKGGKVKRKPTTANVGGDAARSLSHSVKVLWTWLLRRLDATYLVASALIAIGAAIFLIAQNVSWLQAPGGALIGTGFTLLITTMASRRAIHEQYAKDANLRRKNDLYGPLYGEIKGLRETLQRAFDAGGAYPQRITTSFAALNDVYSPPPGYPVPTLIKWPTFKQGYYWYDFTESARHILDHLLELANAYNQAVSKVPDATIEVLSPVLEQAIQQTKASDEYIAWHKKYPTEANWIEAVNQGIAQPVWFRRLDTIPPPNMILGHAWASSWITSWPFQHEPKTIGFLLAGNAKAAARTIYNGYQHQPNEPAPPVQWIEDIIQGAMPKLEALPSYQEVHAACGRLYKATREAEQMLLSALNDIQRRYEGGRPPL